MDENARSCHSKKRYGDEKSANAAAADCFQKRQHWLRVYACDLCNGYHLTHKGALPKAGWRPPALSQRDQARKARGRRRR